jgi:enamine deaminase RidA (YjgF/YER057c/UK114 family)
MEYLMSIEQKLDQLGLSLPQTPTPLAAYIPAIKVNDLVFTSGQLPMLNGELKFKGKVGSDLSKEQGYEAARICLLNALSAIKGVIGDLNDIEKIIKLVGFVNCAPGFTAQPAVINGASELLKQLWGESGAHARSAVGVAELPLNAAVEIELIVKIK